MLIILHLIWMKIKSKLSKSPIIPIEMLLKFQHILSEVGKFERFYKEMQIHDLQKELDECRNRNFKNKISR